jgi:hypothetical protein
MSAHKKSWWRSYAFAWVTLGFFIFSLAGHWLFAWFSYVQEQKEHGQPIVIADYVNETARDTLENWQSEFLQLLWQVGGLALFLYIGSPQSKEGDDRKEAKIDEILKRLDPENGAKLIAKIDREFTRE